MTASAYTMTHYTNKMWFDEIRSYLIDVIGMNDDQVRVEFEKRFPELLAGDLI